MIKRLLVIISFLSVFISACEESHLDENGRALPIHGNREVEYKIVDGVEVADTIFQTTPPFFYYNQDSIAISSEDYKGKVFIVDFFFTHCPTICPPMTAQMKRLENNTNDLDKYIHFFSFSIDPKRDIPSRLREYRSIHGINSSNWDMLTGVDAAITHDMAGQFFSYAKADEAVPGGFGHTSYFVLIDAEGRVRGTYDGTITQAVDSLENDLRNLLKYEYKHNDVNSK